MPVNSMDAPKLISFRQLICTRPRISPRYVDQLFISDMNTYMYRVVCTNTMV